MIVEVSSRCRTDISEGNWCIRSTPTQSCILCHTLPLNLESIGCIQFVCKYLEVFFVIYMTVVVRCVTQLNWAEYCPEKPSQHDQLHFIAYIKYILDKIPFKCENELASTFNIAYSSTRQRFVVCKQCVEEAKYPMEGAKCFIVKLLKFRFSI